MQVTTIIPTYNRAKACVVAVESALAQTHREQEILVIDDGSTDDTEAAMARFGERIRYVKKPNGGVSAARNLGIEMARGEAIAFLDSDDSWMPEKLARQVEVLRARPAVGIVITSMLVVNPDGSVRETFSRRKTIPEDGRVLAHVLRNPAMTPSTALIRTDVLRALGGFDPALKTAEDLDLHLRIALHHEVAVIDEPLARYLRSDAGLSASTRSYHDYVAMMERFVRRHADEIPAPTRRAALFGAYVRNARGLLYHHEYLAAARFALRGLRNARHGSDAIAMGVLAAQLGRSMALQTLGRRRA